MQLVLRYSVVPENHDSPHLFRGMARAVDEHAEARKQAEAVRGLTPDELQDDVECRRLLDVLPRQSAIRI
eukprot:1613862-Lingulodinium_polyedra.AAC.1